MCVRMGPAICARLDKGVDVFFLVLSECSGGGFVVESDLAGTGGGVAVPVGQVVKDEDAERRLGSRAGVVEYALERLERVLAADLRRRGDREGQR
eukprot:4041787-Pleurochrysis_carterae.AAC.3